MTRCAAVAAGGLFLASQRSFYPHVDVNACMERGVLVCPNWRPDTPSYSAAELTLALAFVRRVICCAKSGPCAVAPGSAGSGVRPTAKQLGLYGYSPLARDGALDHKSTRRCLIFER